MTTLDLILTRYGVLFTLDNLAELFHARRDSIRMQVARNTPLGKELNACKFRRGRRIYFRAQGVAAILDNGDGANDAAAA